jgi:putative spermidine/putrescine transport system ATP-binding protein
MTIRLNNAAKTFPDGTKALLPTELTVKTGEIVSLLGPSGCGKTTLLRIISGLETSNPGSEIWFDDDNVTLLPVERRNVGMVFQSYALFPNMSVRANIGYGLKFKSCQNLKSIPASMRFWKCANFKIFQLERLASFQVDSDNA